MLIAFCNVLSLHVPGGFVCGDHLSNLFSHNCFHKVLHPACPWILEVMQKEVEECRRIQVLQKYSKTISRMTWRNMDSEQFAEANLDMMKELSKVSMAFRKSDLRRSLAASKISLTGAEQALLVTKIRECVTYCRRKHRDSGSGKFMPHAVKSLLRLWSQKCTSKASRKKAAAKIDSKPDMKETSQDPPNIREIFGLKPTKVQAVVSLLDESDDDADGSATGSPWGLSKKQPLAMTTLLKKQHLSWNINSPNTTSPPNQCPRPIQRYRETERSQRQGEQLITKTLRSIDQSQTQSPKRQFTEHLKF